MYQLLAALPLLLLIFNSLCASSQVPPRLRARNSSVSNARSILVANHTIVPPGPNKTQSCGVCGVGGPNVDVYYWPQPSANTSCLNIIGPTPSPPLAGATTANGETYWGYKDTVSPYNIIQTMVLTSIDGIIFKMPLLDPWPDAETAPITAPQDYTLMEPIGKRNHATLRPISIQHRTPLNESFGSRVGQDSFAAGNNTLVESTVVYNGHTLTSPSIYVNFYSLTATEICTLGSSDSFITSTIGGGLNGVVTSTLIAFAPGELSTFAAPLNEWLHGMQPGLASSIVPYNFADLPCPPYETMTDQWYKPEPGLPYRPVIAFPPKVLEVDLLWKSCTPGLFVGFDPPTALQPAMALVTPAAATKTYPVEAKPSPSLDKLPVNTPKPPAKQVLPARKTAVPNLATKDPTDKKEESDSQTAVDPSISEDPSNSNNSGEGRGSTYINPVSEVGSAITRVTPQGPTTARVKNEPPSESGSPKDNNDASPNSPAKVGNPDGNSDPGSSYDSVSAESPSETDESQQPRPIATAGGEPIIAIPQQSPPPEGNEKSFPSADADADHNTPNGNNDIQQDPQTSSPLKDPATLDPQPDDTPAGDANASIDPAAAPVSFTTTIAGYTIQALPSPNAILVDGKPLTRGQSPETISHAPIILEQNGDLIIGTSTISTLLPPDPEPTSNDDQVPPPNNNMPPAQAPQVYRIGSAKITAGGPAITYSGTKIQALSNGFVIVGASTYSTTATPAAIIVASGTARQSVANFEASSTSGSEGNSSVWNTSSSPGSVESTGSKSGDAVSSLNGSSMGVAVPYEGKARAAKGGGMSWGVLISGLVVVMVRMGGWVDAKGLMGA